ncbi:MAG: hypothetical protein COB02_17845 [Candidatus Cloacimonadota bacterium]|nr:MAG: hypothetical protein COB02_17845 [Candidatus Cloacimonadota bacterium]
MNLRETIVIKVLLIDDDSVGSLAIKIGLEVDNAFEIKWLKNPIDGLQLSLSGDWDIILLDVNMSSLNGFELLRQFRVRDSNTPIIMITVRSKESDILMGLNLGADDYLCKPFSLKILKARVSAMTRRFQQKSRQILYNEVTLDLESKKLIYKAKSYRLNIKEFNLLKIFFLEPNRVHTRDLLLDRLWGFDSDINDRTVDTLVTRLRRSLKKIGIDLEIKTIRGVGYTLNE